MGTYAPFSSVSVDSPGIISTRTLNKEVRFSEALTILLCNASDWPTRLQSSYTAVSFCTEEVRYLYVHVEDLIHPTAVHVVMLV